MLENRSTVATAAGKSSAGSLAHRPAIEKWRSGLLPFRLWGREDCCWWLSHPCMELFRFPRPLHSYLSSERRWIKALPVLISQDSRSRVDGAGHFCQTPATFHPGLAGGSSRRRQEACRGLQDAGGALRAGGGLRVLSETGISLRAPSLPRLGFFFLLSVIFSNLILLHSKTILWGLQDLKNLFFLTIFCCCATGETRFNAFSVL